MELCYYQLGETATHVHEVLVKDRSMSVVGKRKKYTCSFQVGSKVINNNIYATFYFRDEDYEGNIDWGIYWNDFFNTGQSFDRKSTSSFGVILIENKKQVYAVSHGRAFNYIQGLANVDFGLDVAEIFLDENQIDIKSAKYFKKSKNKALTQYNKESYVTSEIGESDDFVIGKCAFKDKYNQLKIYKYKDKIKFGSSIKLVVGELKPKDILQIICEIDYIKRNTAPDEKTCNLPRLLFVKNTEDFKPTIEDLNKLLLEDIVKKRGVITTLSYYEIGGGDVIITPNEYESTEILYDKKRHKVDFDVERIGSKLIEIGCNDISKVKIYNGFTGNGKELTKLIDFVTPYKGKNYCLYNGKWATYNTSFLDYIERDIRLVNQITAYDDAYELTKNVLTKGNIIKKKRYPNSKVKYTEFKYNLYHDDRLGKNSVLLDREKINGDFESVEFADLYLKAEKSLMHVKIGDTASLRYCIEQSRRTAEIFRTHSDVLKSKGINEGDVQEITMLFVTNVKSLIKGGKVDFQNSSSIYFRVELIEWMNTVRTLGYEPKIIVAKDKRK